MQGEWDWRRNRFQKRQRTVPCLLFLAGFADNFVDFVEKSAVFIKKLWKDALYAQKNGPFFVKEPFSVLDQSGYAKVLQCRSSICSPEGPRKKRFSSPPNSFGRTVFSGFRKVSIPRA